MSFYEKKHPFLRENSFASEQLLFSEEKSLLVAQMHFLGHRFWRCSSLQELKVFRTVWRIFAAFCFHQLEVGGVGGGV